MYIICMSTFEDELLNYDDCIKTCPNYDKNQGCMLPYGCFYWPDESNDRAREEWENNRWF